MSNSYPIEFPVPSEIRISFRKVHLSAIASRDWLIILFAFSIASCGSLFGEKIQVQGGLGWDGAQYCTLARQLNEVGGSIPIDAYRLQRILPSAIIHVALRGLGMELTNRNVISGFGILNIACIALLAWCWCRIVKSLEISVAGKWLGACGLFLNYSVAKNAAFYPLLTDISAMAIGGGMLCCYLESRQRTLILLMILGAFTWPTLLIEGSLLAMFPRKAHLQPKRLPAPAKANVVIASLAAYYYTVLLISISHRVTGPTWNGVVPIRSVMGLSIAIAASYVFFVALRLLDNSDLFNVQRIWRAISNSNGIMVFSVVIGVKCAQSAIATLPATLNPQTYALLVGTWSMAKPGVFLLAQAVFFGPLVIVSLLLWKPISQTIHQFGVGLTLAILFGLANALDSEARHVVNFVPLFFPFVVKVTDAYKWTWRQYAGLAALSVVFSKCWFQINVEPWVGNQFRWPDQRYAMSVGPYMNDEMYLLQGSVLLVATATIYWSYIQPGVATSELICDQSNSQKAA